MSPRSVIDLVYSQDYVPAAMPIKEVVDYFKSKPDINFIAVVDKDALSGLIGRESLLSKIGTQFGWALYADKPVLKLTDSTAMAVDGAAEIIDVLHQAVKRKAQQAFDDIIVADRGAFGGLVSIRQLMLAHLDDMESHLREVERQRDLMIDKNKELIEANMRALRAAGIDSDRLAETSLPIVSFEQDGRLSHANAAFCKISGRTSADMIGRLTALDLFPYGFQAELQDYLDRAKRENVVSLYPVRLRQKSGILLWVDVAFEYVRSTGQLILSIADIPDDREQQLQNQLAQHYAQMGVTGEVLARQLASTMRKRGTNNQALLRRIDALTELATRLEEPAFGPSANSQSSKGALNEQQLQGNLTEFSTIDLAQLLVHGSKVGILVIKTATDQFRIAFDSGQINHAECTGLEGFDALAKAMQQREGTFRFHFYEKPQKTTLTGSGMSLLMDACRLIDETLSSDSAPATVI